MLTTWMAPSLTALETWLPFMTCELHFYVNIYEGRLLKTLDKREISSQKILWLLPQEFSHPQPHMCKIIHISRMYTQLIELISRVKRTSKGHKAYILGYILGSQTMMWGDPQATCFESRYWQERKQTKWRLAGRHRSKGQWCYPLLMWTRPWMDFWSP